MTDHNEQNNQTDTQGQTGIDAETERRNRENETGQQSQQPAQASQSMQSDTLTTEQSQAGGTSGGTDPLQGSTTGFSQTGTEGGSGFVGSASDQSSDYLTKGENEDFQPEDQTDTSAGTSDIETGQSTSSDSTLDDGSDTSR